MRRFRFAWAACLAALVSAACAVSVAAPLKGPSPRAWSYVVIGVEDLDRALEVWQDRFGMEVSSRERGGDVGLSRIWGLPADAIVDQALLNTPGVLVGGVHLVQFARAGEPVRDEERAGDLLPAALEVAVSNLDARITELEQAGVSFASPVVALEARRHASRGRRLAVHDAVQVTLVEERRSRPIAMSRQGYTVAAHLVAATDALESDVAFFRAVLGLELLAQQRFEGVEVRKLLGEAVDALEVRVLGARDSRLGGVKLVSYPGLRGRDLYWRSAPPARGLLSLTYVVPALAPILERGRAYGLADHGVVNTILGEGRMASVTSPAGLRIDIVQL